MASLAPALVLLVFMAIGGLLLRRDFLRLKRSKNAERGMDRAKQHVLVVESGSRYARPTTATRSARRYRQARPGITLN